jgi:hypothetical protein
VAEWANTTIQYNSSVFNIHQILFDGKVPPLNLECIQSWAALPQGEFTIHRWSNEQLRGFVAKCPPVVRKCLERAKNFGEASDILRIAILNEHGGIYMDWDIFLADPVRFCALFREHASEKALLLEDPRTQDPDFGSIITHSWIYSNPQNPLLLAFLEQMFENYAEGRLQRTVDLTGPHAFTRFLNRNQHYLDQASVIDQSAFFRYDFHEATAVSNRRALLNQEAGTRESRPLVNLWTNVWIKRSPYYIRMLPPIPFVKQFRRSSFEKSKSAILAKG